MHGLIGRDKKAAERPADYVSRAGGRTLRKDRGIVPRWQAPRIWGEREGERRKRDDINKDLAGKRNLKFCTARLTRDVRYRLRRELALMVFMRA